jgi:Icc-related predicted phosphoesterase
MLSPGKVRLAEGGGNSVRLLLFSDLHADERAARRIVERASAFDVLIGAGDFGNVRSKLDVCMKVLRRISKPCVLVAGNNESTNELERACHGWEHAHVLHGTGAVMEGVPFFGIGGGVPVTPFGSWSYDFTEDQATDLLRACPRDCVLISHSPPKGVADVSSNGRSLGSTAVSEAIVRVRPKLVVCGHIHASAGKCERLENVPVVNAGPVGVEWELP